MQITKSKIKLFLDLNSYFVSEFQLPSGSQWPHPHTRWGSVWEIPHSRQAGERPSRPRGPHRPCGRVPVQDLWEVSCGRGGPGRSGNESKCGLESRLSATRLINPQAATTCFSNNGVTRTIQYLDCVFFFNNQF